jgi:hypothetical protein
VGVNAAARRGRVQRGALTPASTGQELAGHADLSPTQRYMHLSPAATEDAIRLLDGRHVDVKVAQNVERCRSDQSGGWK